ncbi:PA2169 family four-helix-bundle protein [Phenylobacterium sp.]|uniref:PA2169 family four-helix-bundle protein n=1 Tax=Phenylobacterium sp. TaxID=1871053 RepID=UPI002C97C281|nr:PA2169 family four-helix-bundle protein [Phenylobacterium sp.]HVI33801.1 PA2169 family four-helix-bundle protein [Phenylobacterium sp.]
MDATHERAVKVLNSLIETTLDSANGYEEAAENIPDGQLKTLFAERSRRRMDLSRQLQEEVRTFGGTPEHDQSMLGKAHNKFVDIKNAVMGGASEKAVIDEVERGEDFIKGKFEQAMRDDDLPANARSVVSQAYESIRADHDQISALKHSMH